MIENFLELVEDFFLEEDKKLNLTNKKSKKLKIKIDDLEIVQYINEFWTSRQRQMSSIHEISYRACFKPQLPNFFIKYLSREGDYIYDPFLGRGTTIIEAALLNRKIVGNDINPLSKILSEGRLLIPDLIELKNYLDEIPVDYSLRADIDISMFYHKKTESELLSLRNFILKKEKEGKLNKFDKWIRMVATNRLTGHSAGFFSVYTLPPNQAVTADRQIKLNEKSGRIPEYRDVKKLILKKSKSLIKKLSCDEIKQLEKIHKSAIFLNNDARFTHEIKDDFIQLTITSPPFLDVIEYSKDNWLRAWFNGIDIKNVEKSITMVKKIDEWVDIMKKVLKELYRITKKGGFVAFEVGEVKRGKIKLDEYIVPLGDKVGFKVIGILINNQKFTKTANIWGVSNNNKGTNSNRIVIFQKE